MYEEHLTAIMRAKLVIKQDGEKFLKPKTSKFLRFLSHLKPYYEGETVNLCLNIESLVVLSRTHLKLRFLNVKSEWMIVALLEFHQAISEKKSGV